MSDPHRSSTTEPGHRYQPRQVQPRVVHDVHRPVNPGVVAHSARPHSGPAQHTPGAGAPTAPAPRVVQDVLPRRPMQVIPPDVMAQYHKQSSPSPSRVPAKHRSVSSTKPAAPRLNRSLVLHRRIADKATMYQRHVKQQRVRSVYAFVLGGVAALVFMGGLLLLTGRLAGRGGANTAVSNSTAKTLGAQTDQTSSAVAPSEIKPTEEEVDIYDAAPDKPRVVTIAQLGVVSRVTPVKSGYNGEPLPTGSIFDMGWLSDSALPGATGVVVLSGYTAGPTKPGPLMNIGSLKVGDDIVIEQGDGKTYTYKVVRSEQYDANKVDMNAVRSAAIAGRPGLNIITYTGRFNVRTNQFEQRTAIFATLQ